MMVFGTGKKKNNGFYKIKGKSKDKLQASFFKERLIVPNALRKRVAASHHHTPRSPQKKRQETVSPSTIAEPLSSDSLLAVSPIAEPLSSQSVSLGVQEVMPRELRSAKNNNNKRKNYGKNSPTFILKDDRECYLLLYLCFFIVILKLLYSEMYCTFAYAIYRLFLFSYNFSC